MQRLERMKIFSKGAAILTAATMVAVMPALAQNDVGTAGTTTTVEDDRPNYTPLLGLLGLLGLMGLKRRRDTHDYRTTTDTRR